MQYNRFVKPAYDDFIRPTMKYSDLIVPFRTRNDKAVEMIIQNMKIKMKLLEQQIEDMKLGNALQNRTVSELEMSPEGFLDSKKKTLRTISGGSEESSNQVTTGVILPSDKTQEKAAKLLRLIASLQVPDAQVESANGASEDGDAYMRRIQLKLALKELLRMLVRHYSVVKLSLSDTSARFSAPVIQVAAQVVAPVTLTFATAVHSEELENKCVVALTSGASEGAAFEATTMQLTQKLYSKIVSKGQNQ